MLDLHRVRVFYEVAERRSFSAAAAALNYSQPSVSHHVTQLERETGQRLINRGARPLTLTQAGRVLHAAAAVALAEFARAEVDLAALACGAVGCVTLGSVTTGLRTVVPPAVRAFRQRLPEVDLVLDEAHSTSTILAGVRSGKLDIGIVVGHDDYRDSKVFSATALLQQPMLVSVPAGHRLARRKTIELRDLAGEHLLLAGPERFPDLRAEIDALIASAGLVPRYVTEISDDVAGARLVAAGVGVAIVPGLLAAIPPGVVVVPITPAVQRRLCAVTIPGRQSAPVRDLLDDIESAAVRYRRG